MPDTTATVADTIAAVATPAGAGGIGIIRISGSNDSIAAISALFADGTLPPPRLAQCKKMIGADGALIDDGLALYFPAPHSFTGEAVLELHAHGGVAVLHHLLQRCLQLGARQAEPGEFSLRAYRNGKLNLPQAEALVDLIAARTQQQAQAAARSLAGAFSDTVKNFRDKLLAVRADLESALDFSDDDALTPEAQTVSTRLAALAEELNSVIRQTHQGILAAGGVDVLIVGAPNVGKSSLLNALAKEEVAIVDDAPGTTRDLVECEVVMDGLPFRLTDSAGWRDSQNRVEQIGIRRAGERLQSADVVLSVFDKQQPPVLTTHNNAAVILLRNKIDLPETNKADDDEATKNAVRVSAKTGAGLDALRCAIITATSWGGTPPAFSARQRHINALRQAQDYLTRAVDNAAMPEVAAAWLADAAAALNTIMGGYDEEDLLGDIFSRFCVGK